MSAKGGSAFGGKKIFNMENLIYLAVIFLPAYLIRFKIFGIPTNILEMLILFIFIGWIINFKKDAINYLPASRHGASAIGYKKYIIPIFFIFLGLAISTLANGGYAAGLGIIKSWFFFPMLFVFLASQILDKEKIINVYKSLYLSAFLVSLISLGYLFSGHITYDGRLQGFFNSPNYLAMYLAPALIMLVQVQSFPSKADQLMAEKLKVLILLSGSIILITFYFTYSYAAWISVILSLIMVSIIKNKALVKNKTIIILVLLAASLFIIQLNSEKLINLKNYNRSSLESRIIIWKSAEKMLENNWVFGIGPGNFQEKYLEYQKYYPPYLEWAVPHPHNLYLAFWLYGGVLGFLGFIFLLGFWLEDIIKKSDSIVKFIAFSIMFYILIHGAIDTNYFKNDLAIIFWLNFLIFKI